MKNEIVIHGRLGRDPELKTYTGKDGKQNSLVNLSVGVSRDRGEETDWFRVTMFGKRAEVIDKFFQKGSEILITGRMQNDVYEKDGQKRDRWKVIATDFDFCGSKPEKKDDLAWAKGAGATSGHDSFEAAEEDIPF